MKKLVFILAILLSNNALAQFGNTSLQREIDILKEDVAVLQRQNYKNKNSENNGKDENNSVVAQGAYDENLRKVIGKVDELEYKIKALNSRIDMLNKDIDVRIAMIEGKPISGGGGAGNLSANKPKFAPTVASEAPKSVVGDSISKNEDLAPVKGQDVNALYQEGLTALKANDYTLAENNFTLILNRFATDKLAGNAQYWLGEVYYGKKDYAKSAVAFAKGYQNYKTSPKGADSLLKLGMAMNQLGKKAEACTAFTSMKTEFPKAEKVTADKALEEAKKLDCK